MVIRPYYRYSLFFFMNSHRMFVSLILDEVKVKPSVEWDKRKMAWSGKVDIRD